MEQIFRISMWTFAVLMILLALIIIIQNCCQKSFHPPSNFYDCENLDPNYEDLPNITRAATIRREREAQNESNARASPDRYGSHRG